MRPHLPVLRRQGHAVCQPESSVFAVTIHRLSVIIQQGVCLLGKGCWRFVVVFVAAAAAHLLLYTDTARYHWTCTSDH